MRLPTGSFFCNCVRHEIDVLLSRCTAFHICTLQGFMPSSPCVSITVAIPVVVYATSLRSPPPEPFGLIPVERFEKVDIFPLSLVDILPECDLRRPCYPEVPLAMVAGSFGFNPHHHLAQRVIQIHPGLCKWVFAPDRCKQWWIQACQSDMTRVNAAILGLPLNGNRPKTYPMDILCPVLTTLMLTASVLREDIGYGSILWQDMLHADGRLLHDAHRRSLLCESPCHINLRGATREQAALFLACVWLAANGYAAYKAYNHWAELKYSYLELGVWMCAVFGVEGVPVNLPMVAVAYAEKRINYGV